MKNKYSKIFLAWIGAFFCAWLFGNKMLDTPLPPPLFFLAAILYTSVMLAKGKVDYQGRKISVFESVFVKIFTLWTIVILCFMIFRANTFTLFVGIILFVSFIYLPILFWGYKYTSDREWSKSKKVLKILAFITYFAFMISLYYASFATIDLTGIRTVPFSVRFQQGAITCIIFYFLMRYALCRGDFSNGVRDLSGSELVLLLVYHIGPALFVCLVVKEINII